MGYGFDSSFSFIIEKGRFLTDPKPNEDFHAQIYAN
jgi:hypothetical protein